MLEDAQSDAHVPMQSNWLYSQLVNKMFPDLTKTKEKKFGKHFVYHGLVQLGSFRGPSGVEALGSIISKKNPMAYRKFPPLSIEVFSEEWDGVL
jgi:hypothetical protein